MSHSYHLVYTCYHIFTLVWKIRYASVMLNCISTCPLLLLSLMPTCMVCTWSIACDWLCCRSENLYGLIMYIFFMYFNFSLGGCLIWDLVLHSCPCPMGLSFNIFSNKVDKQNSLTYIIFLTVKIGLQLLRFLQSAFKRSYLY